MKAAIFQEAKVMTKLRHPHIVTLWGVSEDAEEQGTMVLVMERMDGTVLARIQDDPELPYAQRIMWMEQTAQAFKYLHGLSKPLVHKDLKPDNILIDYAGNARVADFGLARIQQTSREYSYTNQPQRHGAFIFAPPEIFSPKFKSHTSYDVYSFGMTLFQVVSGECPFDSHNATYDNIKAWVYVEKYRPDRPEDGQLIPDACWNLIQDCWRQKLTERPSFVEIVATIQGWNLDDTALQAVSSVSQPSKTTTAVSSADTLQGPGMIPDLGPNPPTYIGNGFNQSSLPAYSSSPSTPAEITPTEKTLSSVQTSPPVRSSSPSTAAETAPTEKTLSSVQTPPPVRSSSLSTPAETAPTEKTLSSTVLAILKDKTVKTWGTRNVQCRTLTGHTDWVKSVAISTDGESIVSAGGSIFFPRSGDHSVKVWDTRTGEYTRTREYTRTLTAHTKTVNSVAISTDGKTVVSGSEDQSVKVWDIRTGECTRTLTGHTNQVYSVAISTDGETIVSGSRDNTVKVWDIRTGECIKTLTGHITSVTSVAISTDGETIVSGSHDNTVKVWSVV
ncbi:UNVERIFIED_CONTAM: hypothetical protein HDU68_005530 [Siphonaria sp. JEL0065]|nr:hypothetical protein HDU68_005530 [Siphonaria sp. JEL0065]